MRMNARGISVQLCCKSVAVITGSEFQEETNNDFFPIEEDVEKNVLSNLALCLELY